jgi:hypothetical protein
VSADEDRPGEVSDSRPWYWEGNVQATIVNYLAGNQHRIIRVADTDSRERGKDIIAVRPSGQALWVTVKGYPQGTARTSPATEARHCFAAALYDLVAWRGEDPAVALVIALPDFPTYRNMAKHTAWLLPAAKASLFWVHQDGTVHLEQGSP